MPALPAPSHRTLGRPCEGKTPQSENVNSKDGADLVAIATESETLGMSSTETLPRNFKVRCRLSSRLQLARTSGSS